MTEKRERRPRTLPGQSMPPQYQGQPPSANVNLDALLPALQETNARLDGIAQLLQQQAQAIYAGQELQKQVVQFEQQLVTLQQRNAPRGQAAPQTATSNQELIPYLNEILKGIQILADMSQRQATATQGAAPVEVHLDELRPLLEDIRERITDVASGMPASKEEYIDPAHENLVNDIFSNMEIEPEQESSAGDIYSKMEHPPQPAKRGPKPLSTPPYSNMERATPAKSAPRGTPPRTASPIPPTTQRTRQSSLFESAKGSEQFDAMFAEEAAYLEERKVHLEGQKQYRDSHLDEEAKYLDERKEFLARKRAWYLGM